MDWVYLDNNATTRPAPEVVGAMMAALAEGWANPSSAHRMGQTARHAVDRARGQVAALAGCGEGQLIFTSGGTESINAAVRGLMAGRAPRRRLVTSAVEHSAMRELAMRMEGEGVDVRIVGVDRPGRLDWDELDRAVDGDTAVVSIMWANNETGVIFPVERIAAMCRERGVPFHCDATQAVGKMPVDARAMGFDAMSFAGHKFHGPKGVGGLYVRRGVRMAPLIVGGPQERQRRGGTENVPGIVGMGVAAELAMRHGGERDVVRGRRDRLEAGILAAIPGAVVNGDAESRLDNTTNIGFPRLQAEAILLLLSERSVAASAGAACSSGSLEPSHVLKAMGIEERIAHGAIRFSLSRDTTDGEIDRALAEIPGVIERLRRVLPVGD